RPRTFGDASLVPANDRQHGIRFRASIEVLESMGSDVFAYFPREGTGPQSAELAELAADSGRADTGSDTDQVVARLNAATKFREGMPADLWMDSRYIHIFDPSTGANATYEEGFTTTAAD